MLGDNNDGDTFHVSIDTVDNNGEAEKRPALSVDSEKGQANANDDKDENDANGAPTNGKHKPRQDMVPGGVIVPSWVVDESFLLSSLSTRSIMSEVSKGGRKRTLSIASSQETERVTNAIKCMQRFVRGYMVRQRFLKYARSQQINCQSFTHLISLLKQLHKGWSSLLFHLLFTIVVFVFVYSATVETDPPGRSMEKTLFEVFANVEVEVRKPGDLYDYMRDLTTKLHRSDPDANISEACLKDLDDCSGPMPFSCFEMTNTSGFYDYYNRYVLGLSLAQQRYEVEPCNNELYGVYPEDKRRTTCLKSRSNAKVFEPPVDKSVAVNNYTFLRNAYEYYESQDPEGFYTFLNLGVFNLPVAATTCSISILEDLQWIDYRTKMVCFLLQLENRIGEGLYASSRVCFKFDLGGQVERTEIIQSGTLYLAQFEGAQLFLLILYIVLVFANLIPILFRFSKRGRRACTGERVFDMILITAHLVGISLYITVLVYSKQLTETDGFITEEALTDLPGLWANMSQFRNVIQLISIYEGILGLLLLVMAFRTILKFHFHPQLGLITNTFAVSVADLSLFFFLFMLLILFYAAIGQILLGNDTDLFKDFSTAVTSLLFASLGEIEFIFSQLQEEEEGWESFLQWLYFWSFIFFTAILLLNLLLSIVVDSFITIQGVQTSEEVLCLSVWESLMAHMQMTIFNIKYHFIPKYNCCKSKDDVLPVGHPLRQSIILNGGPASLRDNSQVPIRAIAFLRRLEKRVKWNGEPFLYRHELGLVFSPAITDRLISDMRRHSDKQGNQEHF